MPWGFLSPEETIIDRTDSRSRAPTSQPPVDQRHGRTNDPTVVDGLLDRLIDACTARIES